VAKCRRALPAESQRILQVMTRDLRDRLRAFGWTHSALAQRLRCDRSRISHALVPSGEELPPRQLIWSIADVLDAHAAEQGLSLPPLTVPTMRRWYEASRARSSAERRERQERRATAKRIEGAPPASMETHQDLLHALNALVTARFGSQRAMCRAWGLGRPAVSAALGDRRSLSIDLMDAILRVCAALTSWRGRTPGGVSPGRASRPRSSGSGRATTSSSMARSGGHGDSPSNVPKAGGRPHRKLKPGRPLARCRRQAQPRRGHPNEPMEGSA
jgi:hypothetical protein